MHIRSRTSAADLQRARERRAWGSLAICAGAGLTLAFAGLLHRASGTGRATVAPPAPHIGQVLEVTPKQPIVNLPLPPINIPEAEIFILPAQAEPVVSFFPAPDLPEMDLSEEDFAMEAQDILPPVELSPAAKRSVATARPERAGQSDTPTTPPAYKNAPPPPYPPALRAGRVEGCVRVRIAVDASGHPAKVEILTGSGHGEFDTCAKDWILKHWEFTPAKCGGHAIAGTVTTSVRFVLN